MTTSVTNTAASWAIVIFTARESPDQLLQTLLAAVVAAKNTTVIDILVNGNPALATTIADRIALAHWPSRSPLLRVWSLTQGDKANAWNNYIHHIWQGESISFFIDGYVRLNPDAIELLGNAVAAQPDVLGGTGVPSMGRTASAMRAYMAEHGGFHGNLCCITGDVIRQLRLRNINLPFGLYRVDSLMGALLSFGLDPGNNNWDHHRILVHPDASWRTAPRYWWRLSDLKAQVKRIFRQARGTLENAAVKHLFIDMKIQPEQLPATARSLILQWLEQSPDQAHLIVSRNVLATKALKEIKASAEDFADGHPPKLICCGTPQ